MEEALCSKTEIVAFITEYQNVYPIKLMCKVLRINRSTYYKVANRKPSARAKESQKLDADITAVYFATKRRYGAPKIQKKLTKAFLNILSPGTTARELIVA